MSKKHIHEWILTYDFVKGRMNHNHRNWCKYKCSCGRVKQKHVWVEEMEPDRPVAFYKRCIGCGRLTDNADGAHRPFSDVTADMIASLIEQLDDREDTCSYIQGEGGKKIWFPYPEDAAWAIAETYNRAQDQIEWLLARI